MKKHEEMKEHKKEMKKDHKVVKSVMAVKQKMASDKGKKK